MSRSAVSGEHLAMYAHLLLVSRLSRPSSTRSSTFNWRALNGVPAQRCQKRDLNSTVSSVDCAAATARFLGVALGQPVLEVHRTALTFGDKPVEYRISTVNTQLHDYVSMLSKRL